MLNKLIIRLFWDESEEQVRKYQTQITEIYSFEEKFNNFKLEDVKNKTKEFKKLFENFDFEIEEDSKKIRQILEDIKFEAFALVKQTCKLISWEEFELSEWKKVTWDMVPYDVQLVWWLSLHDWNISEMKTWEWKTLVATLPSYLNALTW